MELFLSGHLPFSRHQNIELICGSSLKKFFSRAEIRTRNTSGSPEIEQKTLLQTRRRPSPSDAIRELYFIPRDDKTEKKYDARWGKGVEYTSNEEERRSRIKFYNYFFFIYIFSQRTMPTHSTLVSVVKDDD